MFSYSYYGDGNNNEKVTENKAAQEPYLYISFIIVTIIIVNITIIIAIIVFIISIAINVIVLINSIIINNVSSKIIISSKSCIFTMMIMQKTKYIKQ